MRGVYRARARAGAVSRGSSPHARGLRLSTILALLSRGIIPACAGFTSVQPASTDAIQDHPRMRGVYQSEEEPRQHVQGSSPHARGLQTRKTDVS